MSAASVAVSDATGYGIDPNQDQSDGVVFNFGAGSGSKLVMNCTNVRGASALLEVRLHLPNPVRPASELTSMVLSTGDRGNCPSSFLLDPIPGH